MTGFMLLLSAGTAAIPIAVCYLGRWILDRTRTEPPWIFPLLIVLGGLGGCFFALVLAPLMEPWLLLDQAANDAVDWTTIIQAAAEELGKGLVLCPLLMTRYFRSPIDGALYGLAAGSGFAVVENVMSFVNALHIEGSLIWVETVLTRLGPSIVIHGGCTAVVGLYLGASHWFSNRWLTPGLFVIGWIIATAAHSTWNVLLETTNMTGQSGYTDLAYLFLFCFLVTGLTLLVLAVRLEASLLKRELLVDVQDGHISEEELHILTDPIARRSRKWLPRDASRTQFVRRARHLAYARRRNRHLEEGAADSIEMQRSKLLAAKDQLDADDP